MRVLAKVVVFVTVCSLTWHVSTRIRVMALQHQDVPQIGVGSKRLLKPAERRLLNGVLDGKGLRIRAGAYTVGVFDGQALVNFETQVRESQPGFRYLWVVRILSTNGEKELNRIPYDAEIFAPPVGVELNPTFSDLVNVPQGASRVMVSLYRFPAAGAKQALAAIHATREEAWDYSVLQASDIVEIP